MQVSSAHLMVAGLRPCLPSTLFRMPAALPGTHCMASTADRLKRAGHELKEATQKAAEKVRAGTCPCAHSCCVLAVRAAWLTCRSSTGRLWHMQ